MNCNIISIYSLHSDISVLLVSRYAMVNMCVSTHLVGIAVIVAVIVTWTVKSHLSVLFIQILMSVLSVSRHAMASLYVSIHLVGIAVIVLKVTIAAGQTIIMEVCVWVSIFL